MSPGERSSSLTVKPDKIPWCPNRLGHMRQTMGLGPFCALKCFICLIGCSSEHCFVSLSVHLVPQPLLHTTNVPRQLKPSLPGSTGALTPGAATTPSYPPQSYPTGLTHLKGTEGAPGQSHLMNAETRTRQVAACSCGSAGMSSGLLLFPTSIAGCCMALLCCPAPRGCALCELGACGQNCGLVSNCFTAVPLQCAAESANVSIAL